MTAVSAAVKRRAKAIAVDLEQIMNWEGSWSAAAKTPVGGNKVGRARDNVNLPICLSRNLFETGLLPHGRFYSKS